MSNPRALYAEHARHNATAHDWHDTDAAKALIARWLVADATLQFLAGSDLTSAQDGLAADIEDIKLTLEDLRDHRIGDEIARLSKADQDDDYLIDEISDAAPAVSAVLEEARKDEWLADALSLAPVAWISPTAIAA